MLSLDKLVLGIFKIYNLIMGGYDMRVLDLKEVSETVKNLFIDACENIDEDLLSLIRKYQKSEESQLGKSIRSNHRK